MKKRIGFEAEELLAGYAIVRIARSNFASLFSTEEIIWVELPRNLFYETEAIVGHAFCGMKISTVGLIKEWYFF